MDDLDVSANQSYDNTYTSAQDPETGEFVYTHVPTGQKGDPCYDYLDFSRISYNNYSEGIVLGTGNDLSTIKTAEHTGIKIEEAVADSGDFNYVHGTGSDPSSRKDSTDGTTAWSAFSVKASADSASYKWVSGIGCTTELLRETPECALDPVTIDLNALKTVNGIPPWGEYTDMFQFELVKAEEFGIDSIDYEYFYIDDGNDNENTKITVDNVELDNLAFADGYDSNSPKTVNNNATSVGFGTFTFAHPKSTRYDSNNGMTGTTGSHVPAGDQYYYNLRGTAYQDDEFPDATYSSNLIKSGNDRGYNEHIANAYVYRVKEYIPSSGISNVVEYNTEHVSYYIKVVVSDPKNDLEMNRGVKAEVTVGRAVFATPEEAYNDPAVPANIVWGETQTIWSSDAGEMGQRQQVAKEVKYNGTDYQVKADTNGVEYIRVPAAVYYSDPEIGGYVYLDPQDPYGTPLLESKTGEIYPYDEQLPSWQYERGHPDSKAGIVKKVNNSEVHKDVHGKEYISSGGSYYAADGTTVLKVEDGIFNPDSENDVLVYEDYIINGKQIYEDAFGNLYAKKGTDPETYQVVKNGELADTTDIGQLGNVTPDYDNDTKVTRDKTDEEPVYITHSDGSGYPVKETSAPARIPYYKVGSSYFSLIGVNLTPGVDGFAPADSDAAYMSDFDIFEDIAPGETTGILYYKSDGQYYDLNGDVYSPQYPGTKDLTFIDAGKFNNRVKTSEITVEKKSVDSNKDDSDKTDTFTYTITFKDEDGNPVEFEPTNYVVEPASPITFTKKADGEYEFKLNAGSKVTIYNVPFNTVYTVEEKLEANGWELVETQTGDTPTVGNSRSVGAKITKERSDVTYKGEYEHTYLNRFTELILNKKVIRGDKTKEFSFVAEVSDIPAAALAAGFSYGWMDGANNQNFRIYPLSQEELDLLYNQLALMQQQLAALEAAGASQYEIDAKQAEIDAKQAEIDNWTGTNPTLKITPPALKHGEEVVLVFPYGSKVTVTETNEYYNAFWNWKTQGGTDLYFGNPKGTSEPSEYTYTHTQTSASDLVVQDTGTEQIDKSRLTFNNDGVKDLKVIKNTVDDEPGTFEFFFNVDTAADYTPSGLTPAGYATATTPDDALTTTSASITSDTTSITVPFTNEDSDTVKVKFDKESALETGELPSAGWAVEINNTTTSETVKGTLLEADTENSIARVMLLDENDESTGTVLNVPIPKYENDAYSIEAGKSTEETYVNKWRFELTAPGPTTNEKLIKDIPFGTKYTVTETVPTGWKLKEKQNDTGTVQNDANPLPDATFLNEKLVKLIVEKKIAPGSPDGTFRFRVKFTYGSGSLSDYITDTYMTSIGATKVAGEVDTWEFTITTSGLYGSKVIDNLPKTVNYEVWEVKSDGTSGAKIPVGGSPMAKWKLIKEENVSGEIPHTNPTSKPEEETAIFTNQKYVNLTVTKTVSGNMGDKEDVFGFTLTSNALKGKNVTVDRIEVTIPDTGIYTFTLGHGGAITITDIPCGADIKVEEAEAKGYSTKVNGKSTRVFTESELKEDKTAAYVNTRGGVIPTEIFMPVIGGIIAAVGAAVLWFVYRRRRKA